MTGDLPIHLWAQLDGLPKPYDDPPLRDTGKDLFAEDAYDLRAAAEDEIEVSGLLQHPALRFVRLARIEDGEVRAIVFRVEHYHVLALNDASDDFFDECWQALIERGFEPSTLNQEQHV